MALKQFYDYGTHEHASDYFAEFRLNPEKAKITRIGRNNYTIVFGSKADVPKGFGGPHMVVDDFEKYKWDDWYKAYVREGKTFGDYTRTTG